MVTNLYRRELLFLQVCTWPYNLGFQFSSRLYKSIDLTVSLKEPDMSDAAKPKSIVLQDKPIICVTLDYYNEPSELLVDEIYNCILKEIAKWNKDKEHKDVIEATSLYRDLAFGSPRYMLVMWFKDAAQAATFISSETFIGIRNMAINAKFTVNSSILTYDKGDPPDIGGG